MQLNSQPQPQENLKKVEHWLQQLPDQQPQLVVLPEAFSCFGAGDKAQWQQSQNAEQTHQALTELARKYRVYLCAGTVPTPNGDKFYATSWLFGPDGKELGNYQKIHLFDVDVADNTKQYRESAWATPGQNVVVVDTEFGRVGLAVCYDVRFPELFRLMRQQGAEIIVLPSAFTQVTGAAHWQTLVTARAIEQQVYVVAAGQVGTHANGRQTYGHSMVIDPWGRNLAELADGEGLASAFAEPEQLAEIRNNIPVADHNVWSIKRKYDSN